MRQRVVVEKEDELPPGRLCPLVAGLREAEVLCVADHGQFRRPESLEQFPGPVLRAVVDDHHPVHPFGSVRRDGAQAVLGEIGAVEDRDHDGHLGCLSPRAAWGVACR